MDIDPREDPVAFWIVAIYMVVGLPLIIWGAVWVYGDASKRGKNGVLVMLLCLFCSFPLSLLLWRAARPELRGPSGQR
jgi:hypothetical protein